MRVHVIGGLAVEGIDEQALGSRKARTALRILAVARGASVSVDRLAEALWGDDQPRAPASQLAVIMSRLRRVLGSDRIIHRDGGYALRCDWLDVAALDGLATEAQLQLVAGSPTRALAAAAAARALLTRPISVDDTWAPEDRPAMERLDLTVRRLVARAALAAGDLATGVEAAEEVLDSYPYDEDALRLAMAGLSAAGRSSSALSLYERVREWLADELGTSPSAETDAAHRAVLKGLPVAGVAVGGTRERPASRSLVGRDDELRALDALLASAAAGLPVVVALEGEAGGGKTALATAWIEGLGSETTVLSARCEQLSRALPLQPVIHLVRSALRRAGSDASESLLGHDAELLAPLLDERQPRSGRDRDLSSELVSSPAGIAMLCAALRRVVERMCVGPGVLFIDDIQRADSLTLGWLADLANTASIPLLIVLTRRSAEGPEIAGARIVPVGPLSAADAAVIAGGDRAAELYRRSGGNPLFLTLLAETESSAVLPDTVHSAVLRRCSEVSEAARTLRSAAVLGAQISVDLLAEVLKTDAVHLLDDLDQGVRVGILEERDAAYAFRHAIVREVLEATTSPTRRALLHREAARVLSAQPEADPMAIAHHARLSGARRLESEALTTASRIAADRFDYPTALSLSQEAVASDDTSAARIQRAIVHLRQARYEEARTDAEVAARRGDDPQGWEVAGSTAYYCRDFEGAAAFGEALYEHAAEPRQQVQGLVIKARAQHAVGDIAAADSSLSSAMQICRQHRVASPIPVYAFLKVHMGEAAAAIHAIEGSPHASAETLSTIYTPVHSNFILGYALATSGRAGKALHVLARASDEAARRGLIRYSSLGANMSAWVQRNIGAVSRAREGNDEARRGAREVGYLELEVYAVLDLCEDALAEGDIGATERQLEEAALLMSVPYAYRWRHRLRATLLRGRLGLLRGEAEAALESARELLADSKERRASRYTWLGEVLRLRCNAALDAEAPDESGLRRLSSSLAAVAGPEAWWSIAELAAVTASPLCWSLAEEHRARLAASLDSEDRERFTRHSGARLERIRTLGVTA